MRPPLHQVIGPLKGHHEGDRVLHFAQPCGHCQNSISITMHYHAAQLGIGCPCVLQYATAIQGMSQQSALYNVAMQCICEVKIHDPVTLACHANDFADSGIVLGCSVKCIWGSDTVAHKDRHAHKRKRIYCYQHVTGWGTSDTTDTRNSRECRCLPVVICTLPVPSSCSTSAALASMPALNAIPHTGKEMDKRE